MHELAIAESIVVIATKGAGGRRVDKVHVTVGHLRQVVPSALTFSFELVAQGTPVEGAALDIEHVPAVGWCRRCERTTTLESFPFLCDGCGAFDIDLEQGEELYVDSLELEEVPAYQGGPSR